MQLLAEAVGYHPGRAIANTSTKEKWLGKQIIFNAGGFAQEVLD